MKHENKTKTWDFQKEKEKCGKEKDAAWKVRWILSCFLQIYFIVRNSALELTALLFSAMFFLCDGDIDKEQLVVS